MNRLLLLGLCYFVNARFALCRSYEAPLLNLTIKALDLYEMKQLEVDFEFDGSFVETMDIVQYLNIQPTDTRRLLTGVSRAIRLAKVKLMEAFQSMIGNTYDPSLSTRATETPMDGLMYRFSYVYESGGMQGQMPSERVNHVCIVGPFSLQLTYAIATCDPYSMITYFTPQATPKEYILLQTYLTYVDDHKRDRVVLLEKSIQEYLKDSKVDGSALCDFIHIRDPSYSDIADVEALVYQANMAKSAVAKADSEYSRTVVVWERAVAPQCGNFFYFNGGANVTIDGADPVHADYCYEQYQLRNKLMLQQDQCNHHLIRANDGVCSVTDDNTLATTEAVTPICWTFTARTEKHSIFYAVKYTNGLLGQIMEFDNEDPIEIFVGTAAVLPSNVLQPHCAAGGAVQAHNSSGSTPSLQQSTSTSGSIAESSIGRAQRDTVIDTATGYVNPELVTIFITYSNRVFDDTAFGIQQVLHSIGYANTCVMGDFDLNMYRLLQAGVDHRNCTLFNTDEYVRDNAALLKTAENSADAHQSEQRVLLQIAIGPHEPTVFTAHYIAFQVEHPWSPYFNDVKSEYVKLFADALAVWCFSAYHKQYMVATHGFPADKIHLVPIYTALQSFPDEPFDALKQRAMQANVNFGDVDIAFSGTHSERREAIIVDIYNRCQADRLLCKFLCGFWQSLEYGPERHISVVQSKVILNVHTEDRSTLEVHRINHLLALSKCVITERSTYDTEMDAQYADAVIFADNAMHMYDLAYYYATNDSARAEVERRAYQKYLSIQSDTGAVAASVEAAVWQIVSLREQ